MSKSNIKIQQILSSLIEEVEIMKESTNFSKNEFDIIFSDKRKDSSFENQNERVFNVNMYILMRLFKEEIKQIKNEKGKFGISEYYDLVEGLELPDSIYHLYMEMPDRVMQNKILSYATDIPSFMGIKRN